jgi:catechol 2,3-dioxygenase-like lactoylglutathione lyase family enzyme
MMNSVLHHLGIALRDPKAAEPFFDRLFTGFLGLEKEPTTEAVAGWRGRGTRFYLYPLGTGDVPGSLQHVAFSARSTAEVDKFARWAKDNGLSLISGPKSFPEYAAGYYATYFEGPEGLRLELVYFVDSEPGEFL